MKTQGKTTMNVLDNIRTDIADLIAALPSKSYYQFHAFTPKGEYVDSFMALDVALKDVRRNRVDLYNRIGLRLFNSLDRI